MAKKIILNNKGLRKLLTYLEQADPDFEGKFVIEGDCLRLASDPDIDILIRVPIVEATVSTQTKPKTTMQPPMQTSAIPNQPPKEVVSKVVSRTVPGQTKAPNIEKAETIDQEEQRVEKIASATSAPADSRFPIRRQHQATRVGKGPEAEASPIETGRSAAARRDELENDPTQKMTAQQKQLAQSATKATNVAQQKALEKKQAQELGQKLQKFKVIPNIDNDKLQSALVNFAKAFNIKKSALARI